MSPEPTRNTLTREAFAAAQERRYPDALAAFQKALSLTDQNDDPHGWANIAVEAARVHMIAGAWKEAETLLAEVLRLSEQYNGPDAPETAFILSKLAKVLMELNRPTEAEPLMRRALALNETSLGKNSIEVASDLEDLMRLLWKTNRSAEAKLLQSRWFEIMIPYYLAQDHWDTDPEEMKNQFRALRIKIGDTEAEAQEKIDKLLKEDGKK